MKKNKFVWEKWHNPIEEELNSYNSMFMAHPEEDDVAEEIDATEIIAPTIINRFPLDLINALHEKSRTLNSFDFWTLHTNFDITPIVKDVIEKTDGVETVDVLTRYRVRIGFTISGGFDNSSVRQDIQRRLSNTEGSDHPMESQTESVIRSFDEEKYIEIDSIKKELSKTDESWVMFVLPNGNTSAHSSKAIDKDFLEKMTFFQQVQLLVGGEIYSSKTA